MSDQGPDLEVNLNDLELIDDEPELPEDDAPEAATEAGMSSGDVPLDHPETIEFEEQIEVA